MSNGKKNLVPFNQRTEDEQKEIARKGGIASGQARRRKKSLREAADLYLSLPVADRRKANKLMRHYVDAEDIDNQMAMIAGLHEAAAGGDARAANVLVKILGEEMPAPEPEAVPEDGFMDALQQQAEDVWKDGPDEPD